MDQNPEFFEENKLESQYTQASLFDFLDEVGDEQPQPVSSSKIPPTRKILFPKLDDAKNQKILIALLGLSSLPGVGFRTIQNAFDTGFLLDIWNNDTEIENHPFLKIQPSKEVNLLISTDELINRARPRLEELEQNNISFVAIGHRNYPIAALKKLESPPRWLFIQGDTDLLHSKSIVAIIGSREATNNGRRRAYTLASSLTRHNVVILSGLAAGIDEQAHRGCLDFYGQTIAVLGYGIGNRRIAELATKLHKDILRRGGTIVSEYLLDDPPSSKGFLRRNEIQAALSKVVIPIECPDPNSGTGATIRRAQNLSVPVAGFLRADEMDAVAVATKQTLQAAQAKIYTVDEDLDLVVTQLIADFLPNHKKSQSAKERQNRFFAPLIRHIVENRERIDLDKTGIDAFVKTLKRELKGAMETNDTSADK